MSSTSLSSDETVSRKSPEARAAKPPSTALMLLVAMLGSCLGTAAAGAGGYYLLSSGRVALAGGHSETAKGRARSITLEPVLANLADEGGHAFVRLGLRVELEDDGGADTGAGADAAEKGSGAAAAHAGGPAAQSELDSSIRDTVLTVLGRQKSAELLGPDGKEHLKIELHEAIEHSAVRVKVKELFFTDFVVQQ